MENVTDALKLAAWVLIFVLALSISISAFGQARSTADTIISYRDRENDFFYVESTGKNRIVGIETMIPSIYRAVNQTYTVEIYDSDENPKELYKYDNEKITKIEKSLLIEHNLQVDNILYDYSIYDYIKDNKFVEWLGEEIKEDTLQASQNNSVKKRLIRYKELK